MSYTCYLGGVEMPTPSKLTVKIKNKNKTLILLNQGEINFLRAAGLTEITVPFTFSMLTGRNPSYYLGVLERLKTGKGTTQFILVRRSPDGKSLFDTNMTVSVEEPAADTGQQVVTVEKERDESTAPSAKTYTVKAGDTLWAIAAKYYGNGSEYSQIYNANTDKISNPNLIYAGQVLTIP